jgi:hypothetical protein
VALALSALCACLAPAPTQAQADRRPSGVLSGQLLLQHSCLASGCETAGIGGSVLLDLLHPLQAAPWLEIGGVLDIGLVGGEADTTRVFVPVGASVVAGLFPSRYNRFGVEGRLRGGAWVGGGAWDPLARAALGGGGFLSAGVHGSIGLGSEDERGQLRVTLGLDITRLFGTRPVTLYAPNISLAWRGIRHQP